MCKDWTRRRRGRRGGGGGEEGNKSLYIDILYFIGRFP
jgi:hypothetical protein